MDESSLDLLRKERKEEEEREKREEKLLEELTPDINASLEREELEKAKKMSRNEEFKQILN